ncbi:heme biosynthesis protein HemY [Balneatrix alpica]|uniref:Heme biosynthesis protein HemY n=1 Tax=Balneatrix alpica TaxID=75684 RepID=A0ABV5ZB12_9GAMM|nr:heme biosynthesis HemY N-terminal domain-containing protein [Balneatrix alpica]
MKKLFLFILIVLLLGTWIGQEITKDSGYILVAFQSWTLETSLWIGMLISLLLFMLLHGLLMLFYKLRLPGERFRLWRHHRLQNKASVKTTRGLLALADGRFKQAERWLSQAASKSEQPLINYLSAAQAAQALGNNEQADKWLQQASQSTKGAGLAVGMTQAQLLLERGNYEKALATLLNLRKQAPKHPQILRQLKDCYLALKDWTALTELLSDLRRLQVLDHSSLQQLEQLCWSERLSQAGNDASMSQEERIQQVLNTWQQLPKALQEQLEIVRAYVQRLHSLGAEDKVEIVLRNQLNQHWDTQLVRLYGISKGENLERQLKQAEQWLKQRPDDGPLLLSLGRIALQLQQWPKARQYFEASLTAEPSHEALQELARLLLHLGEQVSGASLLLKHAKLFDQGLPSLPMPDQKKTG